MKTTKEERDVIKENFEGLRFSYAGVQFYANNIIDDIEELEAKLEIAKRALKEIHISDEEQEAIEMATGKDVVISRENRIAKEALNKIGDE